MSILDKKEWFKLSPELQELVSKAATEAKPANFWLAKLSEGVITFDTLC